jgi:hypothetical protein
MYSLNNNCFNLHLYYDSLAVCEYGTGKEEEDSSPVATVTSMENLRNS